jgi:hypothetical protein
MRSLAISGASFILTARALDISGPANKTVTIGRPDPTKTDAFEGVADHIERIAYTDEDHKGFTMKLHPHRKHYDANNDYRRPAPAAPGLLKRIKDAA